MTAVRVDATVGLDAAVRADSAVNDQGVRRKTFIASAVRDIRYGTSVPCVWTARRSTAHERESNAQRRGASKGRSLHHRA
jgi:hypothetical protein